MPIATASAISSTLHNDADHQRDVDAATINYLNKANDSMTSRERAAC
jgi:hypothetical protein